MRKYIFKFIVLLIMILVAPVVSGAVETDVLANDSLAVLVGVESPGMSNSANIIDPTFPRKLEKEGDIPSAVLEWKRIIHTSDNDAMVAMAMFKIARLYQQVEEHDRALKAFENFGMKYPKHEKVAEALYYMSLSSDVLGKNVDSATFRSRLKALFPDSAWTEGADYAHLWYMARKGSDDLPDVDSKRGIKLKERLKYYPAKPEDKAWTATMLSFIPGAGHVYLGDWRTGLVAFIINFIFLSSLFYSFRYKLWSYLSVFGFMASILYVGTLFSAHSLTYRDALEQRLEAMDGWDSLKPRVVQVKKKVSELEGVFEVAVASSQVSPLDSHLWFYRNVIGKFDGDRGNGYPVNSLYAKQAYAEFGPVLGTLMGVDRLLRDWREMAEPKLQVFMDSRTRYVDPLDRNTTWLKKV